MKNKYYKSVDGKKIPITKADNWEMARPFFVDLILLVVDFVFKNDEKYNGQTEKE